VVEDIHTSCRVRKGFTLHQPHVLSSAADRGRFLYGRAPSWAKFQVPLVTRVKRLRPEQRGGLSCAWMDADFSLADMAQGLGLVALPRDPSTSSPWKAQLISSLTFAQKMSN